MRGNFTIVTEPLVARKGCVLPSSSAAVRAVAEVRSASLWWSSELLDTVRSGWLALETPVNRRIVRPGFNRKREDPWLSEIQYIPRD